MSVIPTKFTERVDWFKNRTALWTTNNTAIGVATADVATLSTRATAAAAALAAADVAHANAKSATLAAKDAVESMTTIGSELLKQIKAKAAVSGNSVYTLANVPAPAAPSPKPAPGQPVAMKVGLAVNGALDLSWKCPNPPGASGTIYQIWRRIGGSGEFTYLGGVGTRKYTDATVPFGSSQVTYQIQAVRSTTAGPWNQFNVNFGVSTGGGTTAMVTEVTPTPRLAA